MKYWLIPILVCIGAAEAQAQVYTYSTPFVTVTTGVQAGQNNVISTQQSAPVNIFAVQQLAVGKPNEKLSNDATVVQTGPKDFVNLGQHIVTFNNLSPFSTSQP
ncbi:hypothetical protein [Methylocystis echinoides]|uniref:hypothetical protein n=1 Tax=Methylocystis echinoides TaxID=29468 RepID=UPI003433CCA1